MKLLSHGENGMFLGRLFWAQVQKRGGVGVDEKEW